MQQKTWKQPDTVKAAARNAEPPPLEILVVGEVDSWRQSGRILPGGRRITCVDFYEISQELLETIKPKVVLSPVLCSGFDCFDLAVELHDLNFGGKFRAVAPDLPDPALICSEIRAHCPTLDFDIVFLGSGSGTGLN